MTVPPATGENEVAPPAGRRSNTTDEGEVVSVLPEQSLSWLGTPGIAGHRDGTAFSTALQVDRVREEEPTRPVALRLTVAARDPAARLSLLLEIELMESGLLRSGRR